MKVSNYRSNRIIPTHQRTMTKGDRRVTNKKKRHSSFEWIQLIATICVPVIIDIYTIIDSNKKESIAVADRRKDTEIANNSRIAELDIAEQS